MGYGGRYQLSFEAYHTIPDPWLPANMLATHKALGGSFDLGNTPRVASFRGNHDFKSLWYNLADGVRAGDAACVELAVRFIEDRPILSYSGFTRSRLVRALSHAALTTHQRQRLSSHFLDLLERGDRERGFHEALKLWARIISEPHRQRALKIATAPEVASTEFARRVFASLSLEARPGA